MRLLAIGLAVALFAGAPVAASAADKPTDKAKADAKLHEQGMAEAPPLAQQLGLACTPTDAVFTGQGKQKDAAGKDVTIKLYELVCQEGLGFVILAPEGSAASGFDCLALSINAPKPGEKDNGKLFCKLPQNANPLTGLQPVLQKAGVSCQLAQGRWMGESTEQKFNEYEVACADGQAYVLQVPEGGSTFKLMAQNCMNLDKDACSYFPQAKFLAALTALAAPAQRPQCQVTDGRWMGATPNGENYYEVACADGKSGFVLQTNAQRQFARAIDCARASNLGGGCQLTSGAAAQTEQNALYARLAKQVGYNCAVTSYHSFGQDAQGREIVELACSDHPEGAVAILPSDNGQKGEYWNCLRAEAHKITCSLSPKEAIYAQVSQQISAKGKSCQVSGGRGVGSASNGDDFIEVACKGAPGYMIEYNLGTDSIKDVIACAQAKGVGGGCKLGG